MRVLLPGASGAIGMSLIGIPRGRDCRCASEVGRQPEITVAVKSRPGVIEARDHVVPDHHFPGAVRAARSGDARSCSIRTVA